MSTELTEAEREADLLLEVGHPSRPDRLELMTEQDWQNLGRGGE